MACNASDETLADDKTAKTVRRAARKAASRASRRG